MSLIKHTDKFDRVIVQGVCTVKADRNGLVIAISQPSKINNERKITFKGCGGYKPAKKPKENGEIRWLKQELDFYVMDSHPYAALLKSLSLNDVVKVFGVLKKSPYISSTTGKQKNYYSVELEEFAILYHENGSLATSEDNFATNTDIENDFEEEFFD